MCSYIILWTAVGVPFVSLLYLTGAASSSDQERRVVLCQPVHSVGKSLHPQHGSLRAWGYLTVRAPRGVGWQRQDVCVCVCVCLCVCVCVCVEHCTPLLFACFVTPNSLSPPLRSQTVCHAVQKVCEPECSRQGAGNAGGGGAIL